MRTHSRTIACSVVLFALFTIGSAFAGAPLPSLMWSGGGCTSYCDTGWYASPAVADVDRDGSPDVIAASYAIVSLRGASGAVQWRVQAGHDRTETNPSSVGRTWPGVVVADVDGDGSLEIVTAHAAGWLSVYDGTGKFKPGWPLHPTTIELRSLFAADLDHDGKLALGTSAAISSAINTWTFRSDGTSRAGWPQLVGPGNAWGVYNTNGAAGDLDGSGTMSVVVPSDVHYACAYAPGGTARAASPVFGAGKVWGQIGFWESSVPELRGYGLCDGTRLESYRAVLSSSPATIADLDGNGRNEVVIAGNMYDCSAASSPDRYIAPFIVNADRTRFNVGSWNWTTPPVDTGAPLSEDYTVIENAQFNPVVADLDADGRQELLFPSYDGRLHAFWLDRTEHGNWPFNAVRPGDAYMSFCGEPAVADLDGDGRAEVIVATWPQKSSGARGRLFILDDTGAVLRQLDLPAPVGSATWNGALAAPTLADIDNDGNLEIVLQTVSSGVVAYKLPGTSGVARVMWGTGRWTPLRAGSCSMANPSGIGTLAVSRAGSADVKLSWTGVSNAVRYDGRRSTSAKFTPASPVGQTTGTSLVDPGAQHDGRTIDYYQVRGVNTCGVEGL